MADPTIQTFCCHNRIRSPPAVKLMDEFNTDGYIVVCIVSSFFGIAGAIYQIWIRNEATPSQPVFPRRRHGTTSGPSSINTTSPGGSAHSTGRSIIVWLAVADLCASLGVFLRSALWKYISNVIPPDSDSDDTTNVIFCAVSSAWIQYFYMCTWLWTLCYAINVRRTLSGYGIGLRTYHAYVWSISALLTAVGLSVLYIPDADCHNVHDVASAYLRILPNYLMTYGPMVTVMVANPVLYVSASKEVDRQLVARYSQMTSTERDLMTKFKMKFSLINFVYYLCWLPNLLNGVIIWTMWFGLPFRTIVTIWYIMAITNPLQAFFNALVYQRWNCTWRIRLEPEESQAAENRRRNRGSLGPSEVTPLLQSQVFQGGASSRSVVHSSTVRLMQDADVDLIPKPTRSINSCTLV